MVTPTLTGVCSFIAKFQVLNWKELKTKQQTSDQTQEEGPVQRDT